MLDLTWNLAGLLKFGIFYPIQLLALGTAIALLLRLPVKNWWAWTVMAASFLALVLSNLFIDPPDGIDLAIFWQAGCDAAAGLDPYQHETCLNPPHAFALYWVFAQFAWPLLLVLWTAVNIVAGALLIAGAQRALWTAEGPNDWCLPVPAIGVLTAAVLLSVSTRYCIHDGQLSLVISLALIGALWAQHRGRPLLAGAGLAIASIKTATMLPFLLLFRRRADRFAWLAMAAVGLGMYFVSNPLDELPTRLRECAANIDRMAQPGHMNNFAHPVNFYMVGLDRAIYYLGVTDRGLVRMAQGAILLALGTWIAWRMRGGLAEPAACCLVALYAAIFLYHRIYDMPILALPLVYAAGRARIERGLARWLYVGCAVAVLGVMYLRLETIKHLGYHPGVGWMSRLLEALVIPSGVWQILAAMLCLAAAEHCRSRPITASESPVCRAAA